MVNIALFRQSHRRIRHHTSTKAPFLCRGIHPGRSLQKSLSGRSRVRRLCIATGRCSLFGEGAAVISLDAVHMEGVQVRMQIEVGREEVNDGENHGEGQNEDQQRSSRMA